MLKMIFLQSPLNESWETGIDALKDALKLEAHVTRKIRDIIAACDDPSGDGSGFNDYHVCHFRFFFLSLLTFENFA
jgi:ferritin heavy chain